MARIAAAGVVVIVTGLLSGAESAAGDRAVDSTLTYTCPFPSGTQQISARVVGTFPASGTVGQAIRPSDVKLTATLPPAALADLTNEQAASVAASAQLTTTVVQNGTSTNVDWSGLAAPSTPIPDSGDLSLSASGPVPSATVTTSGAAVFVAGPLTLVLTPRTADGAATSPPTLPLACALQPGQSDMVLVTVPVSGPASSVTPVPSTSAAGAAPHAARQRATPSDDPSCAQTIPLPGTVADAFLAGFSNVNKLNGATMLGRENGKTTGHSVLSIGNEIVLRLGDCAGPGLLSQIDILSSANLSDIDNGKPQLPPAKATFLTFGFMPTTATMELAQEPGTDIEIDTREINTLEGQTTDVTTLTSHLSIRIHDVLINGTPLDVGPHCESATPMTVTLVGKAPEYDINNGGPLTGSATIPPFSGCGVGEDLDPLFTASVSGPGNFMKLIQGAVCSTAEGSSGICPPPRPDPQR
jgi:hypothetical protein